jgi:predicted transcriptional regulator
MLQIILIIVGVIIIVLLLTQRGRDKVAGICEAAMGQTAKKNENKQKIISFLQEKKEAGNEDIRKHIGVSSRSVSRYMGDLEKSSIVEQVGGVGRGVIYRLK